MAYAAGAKIFKDAGETVSDIEQQLSQALVEVEANAQTELKVCLVLFTLFCYAKILAGLTFYVDLDSF